LFRQHTTANHCKHMAAELKRKEDDTIIIAMHPGEVATSASP